MTAEPQPVQWFTTAPHPDPSVYHGGFDQGQRGWRLHAVQAEDSETFPQIRDRRAACGLRPSHGWDLDLFIDRRCARCVAKLGLPENNEEYGRRTAREAIRNSA